MPRPPLPVGTWGRIRRILVAPRRFQARARFRDYDGSTRNVEAWGDTGAAAERALVIALRDRATPTEGEITRETRVSQLADLWIEEIIAEDRITPQTVGKYEALARKVIIPALGNLRLREVSVSRIDRLFKTIAADYPTKARHTRVVLGQMLGMAVRHDALRTNPVRDTARLRRPTRPVRALPVDDLTAVRAAIRRWQTAPHQPCGPRRTTTLADIVDILLATGGRIGEVLALRWTDIDCTGPKTTVTFAGTLVYVKGTGFFRQPRPKTAAGYRTVTVPSFATTVLERRRRDHPDAAPEGAGVPVPERDLVVPAQRSPAMARSPRRHRVRLGHPAHVPQDRGHDHRRRGQHQDRRRPARTCQRRRHHHALHPETTLGAGQLQPARSPRPATRPRRQHGHRWPGPCGHPGR